MSNEQRESSAYLQWKDERLPLTELQLEAVALLLGLKNEEPWTDEELLAHNVLTKAALINLQQVCAMTGLSDVDAASLMGSLGTVYVDSRLMVDGRKVTEWIAKEEPVPLPEARPVPEPAITGQLHRVVDRLDPRDAIAAFERAWKLPIPQGSTKQQRWARSIRYNSMLKALEDGKRYTEEEQKWLRTAPASWWIDHRGKGDESNRLPSTARLMQP